MICLSVTSQSLEEAIRTAVAEADRIDLVELRADLLREELSHAIANFPDRLDDELSRSGKRHFPKILTIRRAADGGAYDGSEAERQRLLEVGLGSGYDYVDLEVDLRESAPGRALEEVARLAGVRVIRSLHDTEGVPADLEATIAQLSERAGEIPKLAIAPANSADLYRIFAAFPRIRDRGGILVGMGTIGIPTRLLARVLGSFLTYCSVGRRKAAPGHLEPETLEQVYGYRRTGPSTRVFGVLGNPVMHSKSPDYHNRVFRERSLNGFYVPFQIDDVADFVRIAELLDMGGASVTLPHKSAVIPHLSEVDETVEAAGACNTVVRSGEGWRGVNTDIPGFLKPLTRAISLSGAAVTVIGAGGAARGIVYALAREGARVLVLNRTVERARELQQALAEMHGFDAVEVGALGPEAADALRSYGDVIVQTTSVGMAPNEEADPIGWYSFSGREIVYDIIYTPETTRLLRRAQAAGCLAISGTEMFRGQAEEQSRIFCELLSR